MANPNQPIFKEHANGIRDVKNGKFYPFKSLTSVPGVAILPRKQNLRYYLRGVTMSYASLVTDAGTELSIEAYYDQEKITLASLVKTTLLVNLDAKWVPLRVLLDNESPVDFTAADITTASATLVYAEVSTVE